MRIRNTTLSISVGMIPQKIVVMFTWWIVLLLQPILTSRLVHSLFFDITHTHSLFIIHFYLFTPSNLFISIMSNVNSIVNNNIDLSGIRYGKHGMYWGSSIINKAYIQDEKVWQFIDNTNITINFYTANQGVISTPAMKYTEKVLISYNLLVEGKLTHSWII